MAATIREVADRAGVSPSTVSRAFTRPEMVDTATRDRVLDVAGRLGYQPSASARSLRTGRTGAIGVLVPDLANPFFPELVRGAQRRARELGHPVLLADSGEDPDAELGLVRTLAQNVDGLVLCSPRMSDAALAEAARLRPVVLVNRAAPGSPAATVPPVLIDNAGGIEQALRHLRALGHHRVGFVAATETSRSHAQRLDAFRTRTPAHGLAGIVLGPYPPTVEGGAAAGDDVLLADVTAVVVANDVMAAGLVARLSRLGLALPERLSIVGFDDIAISALLTPALTTVRIPLDRAGVVAVERLHGHLAGGVVAGGVVDGGPGPGTPVPGVPDALPTELVVRASTASVSGDPRG